MQRCRSAVRLELFLILAIDRYIMSSPPGTFLTTAASVLLRSGRDTGAEWFYIATSSPCF